ncbi:hypothetical protein NLI96_g8242 [Meripilus lineatus]|uniref:Phospholipid/glycerol acyltransferase domain-containing protein n=1 Tax=Meripilus lineatus TaxID=2056292 RepID=A0AAD5UZW4_9APHY|nr:hypothetical protein NLI96_g8242 [Physisporinus lineatus]
MGKKELQWAPLLGQYMTLSGAVFVDRGHNAKAIQSLTAAGETIKARSTSLWMFPEGTRSMRPHNDMLSFKKGAFHTAVNAGVPIVPIVFENYWRLYHKGVFESGTIKVKGTFSSTPNPIDSGYLIGKFSSKVLPPISTEGLKSSDVNELTDRVRDVMVEALKEISTSSPSLPTPPKSQTRTPSQLKAEIEQDPLAAIPLPTDLPTPSSAPSSTPSISSTVPTNLSVSISPSPSAASVSHPDIDSTGTRSRSESRASTSYTGSEVPSSPALSLSRFNGIESGVETEEDEGMVLVGRPPEA